MSTVLQGLGAFFLSAVLAIFAQNAVLSRALGVSRLVKLVRDGSSFLQFAGLLTVIQLLCVPVVYYANGLLADFALRSAVRPLVMVLASGAAMGLVWLVLNRLLVRLAGPERVKELSEALPLAAFNCAVLGTLLVTVTQSYTLVQSLGFALGSGVGYAGALAVVGQAQDRLNDGDVPSSFRGLPITLVYLGILALAIYGFTGHMVVI